MSRVKFAIPKKRIGDDLHPLEQTDRLTDYVLASICIHNLDGSYLQTFATLCETDRSHGLQLLGDRLHTTRAR